MALKNNIILAVCAGVLGAASVVAAEDVLWRVENGQTKDLVPPFAANLSPFPIKEKPVKVVLRPRAEPLPVRSLSQEELSARRRKVRSAEILADIRELLQRQEAFKPDMSNVFVSGVMRGPRGPVALINNNWFAIGENVSVSVMAAGEVNRLLTNLRSVDEVLASMVENEFHDRLSQTAPISLVIQEIGEQEVTFKNADKNQVFRVSFARAEF